MLCLLKAAFTPLKSRLFSAFQAVWQRANTQEVTAAELGHAEEADGGVRRSSAPATFFRGSLTERSAVRKQSAAFAGGVTRPGY